MTDHVPSKPHAIVYRQLAACFVHAKSIEGMCVKADSKLLSATREYFMPDGF